METITSLSPQILASSLEEKKKDLLLLDLRSFMFYNSSHVLNAINICVPNALLKRKNFSLTHIEATITNDDTKEQFKKREGTHIVLYDNDSEKMAKNCVLSCLLQKLREEGLATAVSFLSGGFECFSRHFSHLCVWKGPCMTKIPKEITCASLPTPNPQTNGEAIRILDYLYVGDEEGSRRKDILDKFGLTDILNTAAECPNYFEGELNYLRLELLDCGAQNMDMATYKLAFAFIENARDKNRRVLVHCRAGQSRSPTIVIAYLIWTYHLTLGEAYSFVQDKRPQTSPNLSFMGHLAHLEQKLLADNPNPRPKELLYECRPLSERRPLLSPKTLSVHTTPKKTLTSLLFPSSIGDPLEQTTLPEQTNPVCCK